MIHNFEALNISYCSRTAIWSTKLCALSLLSLFESLHLCWEIVNPSLCMKHWNCINIFEEVSQMLKSSGLLWVGLWCDHNLCQLWNLRDWGFVLSKLGFDFLFCFVLGGCVLVFVGVGVFLFVPFLVFCLFYENNFHEMSLKEINKSNF